MFSSLLPAAPVLRQGVKLAQDVQSITHEKPACLVAEDSVSKKVVWDAILEITLSG